ncbi:MAG TPA: cupin domain-containing protein [Candidatus Limnocylindrales bacterium]|nr:cupin domain-containing protein [Candidatus Limnocylindrales bacterium]
MSMEQSLWVLGHKIRPLATDDSYGMVEIVTPAGVQGPPPHFHKDESEFLLIVQGALDLMRDGEWGRVTAGSFVEIPAKTVHTFVNKSGDDVVWITGWRPKGFEKFFSDFGVASGELEAAAKSLSPDIIGRVMKDSERYGMFLRV